MTAQASSPLQGEIGNRLVGDGGGDDDAMPEIDPDMGGGGALRHFDDFALKLIARAKFHLSLLKSRIGTSAAYMVDLLARGQVRTHIQTSSESRRPDSGTAQGR